LKIFNSVADNLDSIAKYKGVSSKKLSGTLYIHTERSMCSSCGNAKKLFESDFPEVKVKVFHSQPYVPFNK